MIGEVRCHQSYKYIDNSVTFFYIYVGGCGCFSQYDLFYIIFPIINLLVDVLKYFIKHFELLRKRKVAYFMYNNNI